MMSRFRFSLSAFGLGVFVCVAVGSVVIACPSLAYMDATGPAAIACTSLAYFDANSRVYQGRTMELMGDLPWQVVYFPSGQAFESDVNDDHPSLSYTSRYAIVAVALADVTPNSQDVPTLDHLKVVDGQNEAGLSFSLLAYATAAGPQSQVDMTRAILNVTDLGTWTLGQFATVEEVKAALGDQPLALASVNILRGAQPPIHFVLYDRTGASIVIEFEQGEMMIYDNEVGVMTNGPQFSWHLANLNNYAHLTNIDRQAGRFGNLDVHQSGPGIAKAALPSSDTSPDRFVRAAYYSTFAEKVGDPDRAMQTLSQVMNNFDRPRGITKSDTGEGGTVLSRGLGMTGDAFTTEYTLWTKLADLERGLFSVRTYKSLGYASFDLDALAGQESPLVMPLSSVDGMTGDGTQAMAAAGGQ